MQSNTNVKVDSNVNSKNVANYSVTLSYLGKVVSSFFYTFKIITYFLLITGTFSYMLVYLIQKFKFSSVVLIDFSQKGPAITQFLLIIFSLLFVIKLYEKTFE